MKKIWEFLKSIGPRTEAQQIEDYLAASTDLVDLERRQKRLMRGSVPYAPRNPNLRGHV